jgi:hypothetical protein
MRGLEGFLSSIDACPLQPEAQEEVLLNHGVSARESPSLQLLAAGPRIIFLKDEDHTHFSWSSELR